MRIRSRQGSLAATEAWREARALVNLAVPTVLVQLGSTVPPAMTASYIGRHLGKVYLDGFMLASLTGNLLTFSFLMGLFSASDTLSPQAFGAGNYREVGLLAIRGFCGSFLLIVPINVVLVLYMEPMLIWVGEDEVTSALAAKWYTIYICGLPFYSLYNVTWKFLSSQEIMMPLLVVMLITCGVILPIALDVLIQRMGFLGSAVAIVIYQASQAVLLILYLAIRKPHHPMTWPGLHLIWNEALTWKPCLRYWRLGLGGMLANSEWWYWEVLSLLIGTLGVVPLSVHAVPTQVLTVSFMIPLGIGIALSIRIGSTLPRNVQRAQELVVACVLVSTVLFAIMTMVMYIYRHAIFHLFTSEQDVLEGCERLWWRVCVYFFVLAVFGVNMGIATGLGMQWTLGVVTFVFLWMLGLPAVYFFALAKGGGIDAAWAWVYPPYIVMNVVLVICFLSADWHAISAAIRKREGILQDIVDDAGDIEESLLLIPSDEAPKYGSTTNDRIMSLEEKKSEP